MRRVRRTSPEVRVEMAPLIDVVFLLLTFFVFAMVMMVRAQVLDITLPAFGSGEAAEDAEVVTISLDASGGVFVDGEQVGRESLIQALREKTAASPEAQLYLAADTGGTTGDLLALIDMLSRNGFGGFQLLGTPEDGATPAPSRADEPAPGGG